MNLVQYRRALRQVEATYVERVQEAMSAWNLAVEKAAAERNDAHERVEREFHEDPDESKAATAEDYLYHKPGHRP